MFLFSMSVGGVWSHFPLTFLSLLLHVLDWSMLKCLGGSLHFCLRAFSAVPGNFLTTSGAVWKCWEFIPLGNLQLERGFDRIIMRCVPHGFSQGTQCYWASAANSFNTFLLSLSHFLSPSLVLSEISSK